MRDRFLHRQARGDRIAAVDLVDAQIGDRAHDGGDAAAGGLCLDRDGDGVLVVGDQKEHRRAAQAGGVHRLPELSLARRAVSAGDVDDGVRIGSQRPLRLGAADRLQELCAGGARLGDDVETRVAPVARHLPSARVGIVGAADRRQEHLERRHADLQAERPVAVVRVEPVVPRLEMQRGGRQDRLVPRAADLKKDPVLALELDLPVVETPGHIHVAVDPDEGLPPEAFAAKLLEIEAAAVEDLHGGLRSHLLTHIPLVLAVVAAWWLYDSRRRVPDGNFLCDAPRTPVARWRSFPPSCAACARPLPPRPARGAA